MPLRRRDVDPADLLAPAGGGARRLPDEGVGGLELGHRRGAGPTPLDEGEQAVKAVGDRFQVLVSQSNELEPVFRADR